MTMSPPAAIPETDDALDRLNPVERDLLGLLGRGHTAKSIATLRSMSEAAVNERFRSARRKTGIGSSREIARLIVAQENRHDFIDLAPPAAAPPELRRPDAHRSASPHRWRLPMAAAVLLAAAILAQQTAVAPTQPAPSIQRTTDAPENTFVTVARQQPDIAALSTEARSGRSDPAWTPEAEARLSAAYRNDPGMSRLRSVHVTCSDVLCEVLGETAEGATMEDLGEVIRHAESPAIVAAVDGLDLQREFSSVRTNNNQEPLKGWIVSYWRRTD